MEKPEQPLETVPMEGSPDLFANTPTLLRLRGGRASSLTHRVRRPWPVAAGSHTMTTGDLLQHGRFSEARSLEHTGFFTLGEQRPFPQMGRSRSVESAGGQLGTHRALAVYASLAVRRRHPGRKPVRLSHSLGGQQAAVPGLGRGMTKHGLDVAGTRLDPLPATSMLCAPGGGRHLPERPCSL